jgi:hypothetical protein
MLVTKVLGNCPSCGGKNSFGNVFVRGDHILQGCMNCKYRTEILLPQIKKKILYLDQFFFSSAFREHDARFVDAAQQISQVSAMQLLVAPFSSIHEDETNQWRGYDGKNKDDLMKFIKDTSRGHQFEPQYRVEKTQVVRSFQSFLADKDVVFKLIQRDIIKKNIHQWDDYFRIDVGHYIDNIELKRNLKRQSIKNLVDLFPDWRKSTNTFIQDVAIEMQAAEDGYIKYYFEYVDRVASGDLNALFDSPIISHVIESLMHCFSDKIPIEEKFKKISRYFKSPYFSDIPYHWLSARILAKLKEMVKGGAYINPDSAIKRLSGFFQDVMHVSIYAPYCDAFVMDQSMASIVADPRVGLENKYGVKVFSLTNWQEFFDWLDDLEKNISDEHRAALTAVY